MSKQCSLAIKITAAIIFIASLPFQAAGYPEHDNFALRSKQFRETAQDIQELSVARANGEALSLQVKIKATGPREIVLAPDPRYEKYILNAGPLALNGWRCLFARRVVDGRASDKWPQLRRSEVGLFIHNPHPETPQEKIIVIDRNMFTPGDENLIPGGERLTDVIALEDARVVARDGKIYVELVVVKKDGSYYSAVTTHSTEGFIRIVNNAIKERQANSGADVKCLWQWTRLERLINDGPCARFGLSYKNFVPLANPANGEWYATYRPEPYDPDAGVQIPETGNEISEIRLAVSKHGLAGPWRDAGVYMSMPYKNGWHGISAFVSELPQAAGFPRLQLMLYHTGKFVERDGEKEKKYDIGAIVCDADNPHRRILVRMLEAEPGELYEGKEKFQNGLEMWVPGVNYTCGAISLSAEFDPANGRYVSRSDIYYSASDTVIKKVPVEVEITASESAAVAGAAGDAGGQLTPQAGQRAIVASARQLNGFVLKEGARPSLKRDLRPDIAETAAATIRRLNRLTASGANFNAMTKRLQALGFSKLNDGHGEDDSGLKIYNRTLGEPVNGMFYPAQILVAHLEKPLENSDWEGRFWQRVENLSFHDHHLYRILMNGPDGITALYERYGATLRKKGLFAGIRVGETQVLLIEDLGDSVQHIPARRGAVVASEFYYNPAYWYHWVRDAALMVKTLAHLCRSPLLTPDLKGEISGSINDYLDFTRHFIDSEEGKLGDAKYLVNGQLYPAKFGWGNPQYDGPALTAVTFVDYALMLLDEDTPAAGRKIDSDILPYVTKLLKYVEGILDESGIDLWEELKGFHFYTRMAQHNALMKGVALLRRIETYRHLSEGEKGLMDSWNGAAEGLRKNIRIGHIKTIDDILGQIGDGREKDLLREFRAQLADSYGEEFAGSYTIIVSSVWGKILRVVDSSVLGAIMHSAEEESGQTEPFFEPDDPLVIRTLAAQEYVFKGFYPINERWSTLEPYGMGVGRYVGDGFLGGNPWNLTTAWFGRVYFYMARSLGQDRMSAGRLDAYKALLAGTKDLPAMQNELMNRAFGYVRWLWWVGPDGWPTSEQVHKETGKPWGVYPLAWTIREINRLLNDYVHSVEADIPLPRHINEPSRHSRQLLKDV